MRTRAARRLAGLLSLIAAGASACRRGDAPSADSARDVAAATAPIGRIVADSFTIVVHRAERFTPPAGSLWTPAAGHEYVALDVAMHNVSADSIAFGWTTMTAGLVDAEGRRHPFLPELVAAFEMEAPSRAGFDARAYERLLGGRLAPGDSVRAWAWAFEVPRGAPLDLEIASGEARYRLRIGP